MWAEKVATDLRKAHIDILVRAGRVYLGVSAMIPKGLDERAQAKWFAEAIKDYPDKSILFCFYHKKDPSRLIWKQLRPTYEEPVWHQREAS
jgi:hypothetical protein